MAGVDVIVALSTLRSRSTKYTEKLAYENLPRKLLQPFFSLDVTETKDAAAVDEHDMVLRALYAYVVGALCTVGEHARELALAESPGKSSPNASIEANGDTSYKSGGERLLKGGAGGKLPAGRGGRGRRGRGWRESDGGWQADGRGQQAVNVASAIGSFETGSSFGGGRDGGRTRAGGPHG